MTQTVPGSITRKLAKAHFEAGEYEDVHDQADTVEAGANVVCSLIAEQPVKDPGSDWPPFGASPEPVHAPVLDLDLPHVYVPSSTPGHGHLYLDVQLTQQQYWRLLEVLDDLGILEPGYVGASKSRGYTSVRLPWVKKDGSIR